MMIKSRLAGLIAAGLVAVTSRVARSQAVQFDVVIINGRVIDGTGNPWIQADIGIRGNEIVALGQLKNATARRVVDARGLIVAPGFIDLHSHAGGALASDFLEARKAASHVSQGLTTIVGGADGRTERWPLSAEIAAYQKQGIGMNVVAMVGHNTIRREAMGESYERPATPDELERMKRLLREGMEQGAWGLGAGVEYRPGRFSTPAEVIELARVVAEYNGFYVAHQRSEASMPLWQLPSLVRDWPIDGLQGLQETINIAKETGIRVVASHHKARGRSSFGRSAHDIAAIDQARNAGLQVYLDVYPYETFGGGAFSMLPNWAFVDQGVDVSGGNDSPVFRKPGAYANARANLTRRWSDSTTRKLLERDIEWLVDHNGGPDRVYVVDYPDKSFTGKTLQALADERRKSYHEVVVEMALNGYPTVPSGAYIRGYGIHDMDIDAYLRQDYTATSSDAQISGVPNTPFENEPGSHPRHFGAFVRKIARYVKDKGVISLPFAIRSSTGLPAQIIGLRDRGVIREGNKADIVIFDYDRLRDRATILEPALFSEGVEYVLVNGQFTVDRGKLTGALPGVVVRRPPRPQP